MHPCSEKEKENKSNSISQSLVIQNKTITKQQKNKKTKKQKNKKKHEQHNTVRQSLEERNQCAVALAYRQYKKKNKNKK